MARPGEVCWDCGMEMTYEEFLQSVALLGGIFDGRCPVCLEGETTVLRSNVPGLKPLL